jgi:hypothetical protein
MSGVSTGIFRQRGIALLCVSLISNLTNVLRRDPEIATSVEDVMPVQGPVANPRTLVFVSLR